MTTDPIILDMLGDELKTAVLGARASTGDDTIMARIEAGLCVVERGEAVQISGIGVAEAVAYLAGLA